jgi:hypothetical protein
MNLIFVWFVQLSFYDSIMRAENNINQHETQKGNDLVGLYENMSVSGIAIYILR